ncbi:MAG: acyl-CoA dehydrogenase family protein [Desulfurella sp.]|uniref:acyl-CoA dehydrogenase family protein n=2 Tax=Desulfurella sp. TaxID=1962857 RepID=UPI00046CA7F7
MKGGEFIIKETDKNEITIPEEITQEQKQMAETAEAFVTNEILPNIDEIDKHNLDLLKSYLAKAAELGFLGIYAPEEYDGVDLDTKTTIAIADKMGAAGSFAVAFAAHVGIGSLPLIYFGTKTQKDKYLKKLATGEWIAAYCLTEPDAGSDAMNITTYATLSEDGKYYILNGSKTYITNGGIANLFTVFAKINKTDYAAFLVERSFEGVSIGREEDKMGIRGSSTTPVMFDNVKVPVENLLGEIGKGYKVAFSVLDEGRFLLSVAAVGGAKMALQEAIKYANQRKQFKVPLTKFGAIKEKIADMITKIYAGEALNYRLADLYDKEIQKINHDDPDYYVKKQKALEEYSIECSISKIYGSEALDFVVDETVQIFGGYGFIKDYPAERFYRDARINRIFEGTNEINRLLVPGIMLKKAMKNELPLQQSAMAAFEALITPSFDEIDETKKYSVEKNLIKNLKTLYLALSGMAVQKYLDSIKKEEEVLFALADIAINIFALESAVLRADKAQDIVNPNKLPLYDSVVKTVAFECTNNVEIAAKKAAFYIGGDALQSILSGIRRFTKYDANDLLEAKRLLADTAIDQEKYIF